MNLEGCLEERLRTGAATAAGSHPLPAFAKALISLGRALYTGSQAGRSNVAVLVVPTRSLAAWFISLGSVASSLSSRSEDDGVSAPTPGGEVRVVQDGEIYKGIYEGSEVRSVLGERRLYHVIRLRDHQCLRVPDGLAQIVEMESRSGRSKLGGFKPTAVPMDLAFAAACYGLDDPVSFQAHTSPVVTVYGVRSTLIEELRNAQLAVERAGDWLEGSLRDLLRVRDTHANGGYRVVLEASLSDAEPDDAAPVVVLDGALAVLRKGLRHPGKTLLVLIDPAEPSFLLAANELEQMAVFSERSAGPEALGHPGFGAVERAWLSDV